MAVIVKTFQGEKVSAQWAISAESLNEPDVLESGEIVECQGYGFGVAIKRQGQLMYAVVQPRVLHCGPEAIVYTCHLKFVARPTPRNVRPPPCLGPRTEFRWAEISADAGEEAADSTPLYVPACPHLLELTIEARLQDPSAVRPRRALTGIEEGHSIRSAFHRLLRSGIGSDVTLSSDCSSEASGEKTFPAHRSILLARSPVFMKMFSSGMQESVSGAVVKLEGTEPSVLGWFLEFLYTDKIDAEAEEDEEALCHLLEVAHRYEVEGLVSCCETRLALKLSNETAPERLMMAERLGLSVLRSEVLD